MRIGKWELRMHALKLLEDTVIVSLELISGIVSAGVK